MDGFLPSPQGDNKPKEIFTQKKILLPECQHTRPGSDKGFGVLMLNTAHLASRRTSRP